MTAKILAFPTGKHIPGLTKEQKEPIEKKIAREQTKKYANAVADDIVIGLLTQLQQEGLGLEQIYFQMILMKILKLMN